MPVQRILSLSLSGLIPRYFCLCISKGFLVFVRPLCGIIRPTFQCSQFALGFFQFGAVLFYLCPAALDGVFLQFQLFLSRVQHAAQGCIFLLKRLNSILLATEGRVYLLQFAFGQAILLIDVF